jgi:hypothetical protein
MKCQALVVLLAGLVGAAPSAHAQVQRRALRDTVGLRPHNTAVAAVQFKGRAAVRVSAAGDGARRPLPAGASDPETFVRVDGVTMGDGVIEVEVAGAPAPGAGTGARGFVGIAFRMLAERDSTQPPRYDAFYLRPTNGRADDQERRNHAVQYISHPDWTWSRLRRETPSRYEAYVDLVPDTWTKMRIEIRGTSARLFVHGQPQPTLIVNDLKSGAAGVGGVALWIGPGTIAHFRNLVVRPAR